jgi:hypothetical protein
MTEQIEAYHRELAMAQLAVVVVVVVTMKL